MKKEDGEKDINEFSSYPCIYLVVVSINYLSPPQSLFSITKRSVFFLFFFSFSSSFSLLVFLLIMCSPKIVWLKVMHHASIRDCQGHVRFVMSTLLILSTSYIRAPDTT